MNPAVLVLAAGMASRMGAAKALLSLPSLPEGGRCSALRGLVSLYRSLDVENVVIVSGFHAEIVEAEALALGLTAVRNPDPQRGMFSSVQTGVAALLFRILKECGTTMVRLRIWSSPDHQGFARCRRAGRGRPCGSAGCERQSRAHAGACAGI